MKIDWRRSAIAATAAFVLSVLVGIIGGVSFLAVLLRATIGGIVFGAGAIGISALIGRFLPELRAPSDQGPADAPGGKLDIVVGDEVELSGGETEAETEWSGIAPEELEPGDEEERSDYTSEDQAAEASEADGAEEIETLEEVDSADGLPEVEGFAESFTSESLASAGPAELRSDTGNDPATIAKAIRTVLKRDQ